MGRTIMIFDVETTGFSSTDRVIQVAWMLQDMQGNMIGDERSYLIKPEGFDIPERATEIHGITTQYALDNGEDWDMVMRHFMVDLALADVLVGHNVSFDIRMMDQEIQRKWNRDIKSKSSICTMKKSTKYCGKRPNLQALHKKLFMEGFEGAHDALADVKATARCFWKLKYMGLINSVIL